MAKFRKWAIRVTLFLIVLLFVLSVAPYAVSIEQPAPPEKPFDNSRFESINGVRVHVREWPSLQTPARGNVLLIHGFCGSTFSWRQNVDAFAEAGYRVIAVDLPPFGYSDRAEGIDHSPAARATLCWRTIDAIAPATDGVVQTWFVFGHSMGGSVVGNMALQQPSRTAGVIFVDGAMRMGGRGRRGYSDSLTQFAIGLPPVRRWVEVAAKYRMFQPENIRELLGSAYGGPVDDETVAGYLGPLRVSGTASGILDMFSAPQTRGGGNAREITAPAMVIWGDKDAWIPGRIGNELFEELPNADIEEIRFAGHCPMETHAKRFNELVIGFLNKNSGPAAAEPSNPTELTDQSDGSDTSDTSDTSDKSDTSAP